MLEGSGGDVSWLDTWQSNQTIIGVDSAVSRYGASLDVKKDEPRNPENDDAKLAAYLLGGADAVRTIEEVDAAKARTTAAWSEIAATFAPEWFFELAEEVGTGWYLAKPIMYGCAKNPGIVPTVKELLKQYREMMLAAEGSKTKDALDTLRHGLEPLLGHRV